jgi:murein L,D-transpeptidase YcbB/YkuD
MFWRPLIVTALLLLPQASAGQPTSIATQIQNSVATENDDGATRRFYELRNNALAWYGSGAARANAKVVLAVLAAASDEGLDPDRYGVFARSWSQAADDVALTSALLRYMGDLAVGRAELRDVDRDMALPARSIDTPLLLQEALLQGELGRMLATLVPKHPEYARLKAALGMAPTDQIVANMERWRWLPAYLEPDRIMVNTAAADLQMWRGGKPVLTSRVVVGSRDNRSPMLRAEGAGITVNPAWTVPHSIAVKEILPKLKTSRTYLQKHDMVLLNGPAGDPHGLSINWRAIKPGSFPYRIRQRPGPRNPLGQIKIELPNPFDVYLHDTPTKTAFAREDRHLSHGCVRVEQILPLAAYALGATPGTVDKVAALVGTGETRTVALPKRLPVYFLYWTVAPGTGNDLQVYQDVYGRDERLIATLRAKPFKVAGNAVGCLRG